MASSQGGPAWHSWSAVQKTGLKLWKMDTALTSSIEISRRHSTQSLITPTSVGQTRGLRHHWYTPEMVSWLPRWVKTKGSPRQEILSVGNMKSGIPQGSVSGHIYQWPPWCHNQHGKAICGWYKNLLTIDQLKSRCYTSGGHQRCIWMVERLATTLQC